MRLTGDGEARRGAGGKIRWQGAYICYAPAGEVLIEGFSKLKHLIHTSNATDIPAADIPIEATLSLKQAVHIANAAGTGGSGVAHGNIAFRPFGIFNTIYCAAIANCGIRTANSSTIAMEEKGFSA